MKFNKKTIFLGMAMLFASTVSLADTLSFTITGPNSMNAAWTHCGTDEGTLGFTNNNGTVMCSSQMGIGCMGLELVAALDADYAVIYNQLYNWSLYNIIKNAGGTKSYPLACDQAAKVQQYKKKLDSGQTQGQQKSIILKPIH